MTVLGVERLCFSKSAECTRSRETMFSKSPECTRSRETMFSKVQNVLRAERLCLLKAHDCTRSRETIRINLPLFSTVVPASIFMFLSCRPFVAITTLSTGLVGVEVTSVSWLGQLTEFKSLIIVIVSF